MPNHDLDSYKRPNSSLFREFRNKVSETWRWLRNRISHKLEHIRPSYLLDVLSRHGLALVTIIIIWEIIEDVLFPILFIWLGHNVHPAFIAGAPISWLICLHWLMVPLTWSFWMKFRNKKDKK